MKYLSICLAMLMFSCGGGSKEQSESETSSDTSSSGGESCLAEITDPAQWYTVSEVASLSGQSEENIRKKANEKYRSLQFSWKSDRKHTMKVGSRELEIPTNNVIGITIKNLDEDIERAEKMHKNRRTFTYEEYFDSYHTLASDEDMKKIDEQLEKKAEEGEIEERAAKTAKSLMDLAPTEGFSMVDGLGDKANKYIQLAPGLRETRLAVLQGNTVILISADISDDDAEDLNATKAVAEAVIGLCD